jgi:cbb3-type cytochrome oxidase subunit 3
VHKFAQVIPYGAFAIAFTLVTAWMYILLSKRRLDRAAVLGDQSKIRSSVIG